MSRSRPDPKTLQQIDENLRRAFEDQLQEDLPDRLKELLAQLKAKDGQAGQGQ